MWENTTTSKTRKFTIPSNLENIPKLKYYIEEQFASSTFNQSGSFPIMDTPPVCIHLKPDVLPYAQHSMIPVPHHWKTAIRNSIHADIEKKIIAPFPVGTGAEWCSSMIYKGYLHNSLEKPTTVWHPSNLLLKFHKMSVKLLLML